MKHIILLISLLLTSCGIDLKVKTPEKGPETTVKVGPDFAEGIRVCDERYGHKTPESEECFKDYRNYFSLSLSADVESITAYCEAKYPDSADIDECVDSLTAMLGTP